MSNKEKRQFEVMQQQQTEKIERIKTETDTKRQIITFKDPTELEIISQLERRTDAKAERIKRLLDLPDLTKKENSPIKFVNDKIIGLPRFKDFDIVTIPRIINVKNNFDLLNTSLDHPSRKETDTYYADKSHVLCTQTTAMWSFYLKTPEIVEKLKKNGHIEALCPGIVYRKDEIDRSHYPAFHQIDGLYICEKKQKTVTADDLVEVLVDVAKGIYGPKVEWKTLPDTFPYTDPSIELDIKWEDKWLEVLGAGVVRDRIYPNFGLDSNVYNGWAFGFGLDRLAMIKMNISDIRILWSKDERIAKQFKSIDSQYKEVSKFPATYRDISFVIDRNINLNNYYEIIRDYANDLIEEVRLIDKYEDEKKFGQDKVSHTFRIVYRSPEKTLKNKEINEIQEKIREKTKQELNAILR